MNVHEYQAKALFANYAIPVPFGVAVDSSEQVPDALAQIKTDKVVVNTYEVTPRNPTVVQVRINFLADS